MPGSRSALLHGSQPDAGPVPRSAAHARRRLSGFSVARTEGAEQRYLQLAQLTNPKARLAGVSLNTSALDAADREHWSAERELGVPAFDPMSSSLEGAVAASLC